jgi:rsbT co-antagonist protein RsbR
MASLAADKFEPATGGTGRIMVPKPTPTPALIPNKTKIIMNIPELLNKFELSEDTLAAVREAGKVLEPHLHDFIEKWYAWLRQQPEFKMFFDDPASVERIKQLQLVNWREFFAANITADYIARRRHIGTVHARIELPTEIYLAGMSKSHQLLISELRAAGGSSERVGQMADAISKMVYFDSFIVLDTITSIAKQKIAESSKVIMEMATPVTAIWEGILLLPLVGIIDSHRTQDIMNRTLEKISEARSKVFVLDISGVATVDTGVASSLLKITQATRLMGCECIISGISPLIARTLVTLGVNVGEVVTTATLRDAFELALRRVGGDVRNKQP